MDEQLPCEYQNDVPALVGQNRKGGKYRRTSEVEKQIQALLIHSDEEIIAYAKVTDQHDAHFLKEETLVFFIRHSHQEQNLILYDELFMILLERCKKPVSYILRSLDPSLKEDAFSEVNAKLIQKVLRTDGKGDFLQVRFWPSLQALAIDVFRHTIHDDNEDHEHLMANAFLEGDPDQSDEMDITVDANQPVRYGNGGSSLEKEILAWDALQCLRPNVRKAFVLYYYLDWPIDSKDGEKQSISKYFGTTGKTIQNWLKQAEETLEKWRGDHHEYTN